MKAEAWTFIVCTFFFVLFAPAYWLVTGDPTGTSALVMTSLLTLLVSFYLGFHAVKGEARPEDRKDGEIADGAGELGFFPPYSWWPMWCTMCLATIVLGVVIGWWLVIIGGTLGAVALSGLVFEYYRGEHAH